MAKIPRVSTPKSVAESISSTKSQINKLLPALLIKYNDRKKAKNIVFAITEDNSRVMKSYYKYRREKIRLFKI